MISQVKIQEIISKIVEGYNPEKIILFGSYANGTANDNSDIDLLIIKDTDEDTISREMAVSRLLDGIGVAYDILVYNHKEVNEFSKKDYSFYSQITSTGKLLWMK